MHPILFKIGPITIHTYGFLLAAGFLLGLSLAIRQAKREGIQHNKIVDLGFYLLIAALVGSRLFFILINSRYYLENPLSILKIWEGGLVFYGGLMFAIPIAIWFIKKNNLDTWRTGDLFAPSIAIGHAIGRIGCFFAGCCYGKSAENIPWGVIFRDPASLAPINVKLHPTQLYESVGEFIIFLLLVTLRKYKTFNGQLFITYLILYSVLRFIVEFFRGDAQRGFIIYNISFSQAISILLFFIGIIAFYILRKKGKIR